MPDERAASVLDWDGPLSPPRKNGEIVFAELWQSRVFGIAMTLYERGAFRWEEFRDRLIEAIAEWERDHPGAEQQSFAADFRYWDCWLVALERLSAEKELCAPDALEIRVAELAARPPGHDHEPHE